MKGFTPLESPAPWGGDEYNTIPFLERATGSKAPPFLTGFTLIEVLITLVVVGILLTFVLPLGLEFYYRQQLQSQTEKILHTLRQAQFKAMAQESDSFFGVYFGERTYILFKGNSYLERDPKFDESFGLPSIIKISGLQEVVFSKLEGLPNQVGDIILTAGKYKKIININEVGRINPVRNF